MCENEDSFPDYSLEIERKNLLGDHSVLDPPDSIPNSEVKRNSVDGSVGSPHVRVEHRQAFNFADSVTTLLAHNLRRDG